MGGVPRRSPVADGTRTAFERGRKFPLAPADIPGVIRVALVPLIVVAALVGLALQFGNATAQGTPKRPRLDTGQLRAHRGMD